MTYSEDCLDCAKSSVSVAFDINVTVENFMVFGCSHHVSDIALITFMHP